MTLKLNGSSSGSVSIDAPASTTRGADITFKLPVADGSSGQALTTNASGQLAFSTVGQSADAVAKAWVHFDGSGTLEVDDSYNVSSVTDNGTGDYTVNIDTDMANANYCVVTGGNRSGDSNAVGKVKVGATLATGSFKIIGSDSNFTYHDMDDVYAVVFGDQ